MQLIKGKTKRLPDEIVGGTISLTVSAVIVKLLGLIYKIPLASLLGDEGMGYFNSAYTVYGFFYLLCTAGVPKAVMILLSEAKARGKASDESKIIRVAIGAFFILGVIMTLILIVFSAPIAALIGSKRSAFSMVAIAPAIVFTAVSGVIRGCLGADMKLINISVSQVIEGVGKLVCGLAFALLSAGLNMPLEILSALTILGVSLGSCFGFIYLLVCSKIKILRENKGQSIAKPDREKIIKRIFSISVPITISAAIMSITNLIDLGLIMRSLGAIGYSESDASAMYGNYTTLAVPLFNLAVSIITPIAVAFLPMLTSCFVRGDSAEYESLEKSSFELVSVIAAPMMIGMMLFSKEILDLIFPSSGTSLGASLLCLLSPAILFSSLVIVVNTSLEAMGRVRLPLASMLVGSIGKIAVSIFLITDTELGILGAPIGTVISYALALFTSLIFYGKIANRHVPFLSSVAPPYIIGLASVIIARSVYDGMIDYVSDKLLLLICIGVAGIIYCVFIIIFGFLSPIKMLEMAKYTKTKEKNYR